MRTTNTYSKRPKCFRRNNPLITSGLWSEWTSVSCKQRFWVHYQLIALRQSISEDVNAIAVRGELPDVQISDRSAKASSLDNNISMQVSRPGIDRQQQTSRCCQCSGTITKGAAAPLNSSQLSIFAERNARTEQVTIAINIIQAFYGWPVFIGLSCREGCQLARISVCPIIQ